MSASLLRTHMMQISYADSPGPTVTVEKEKRFPFYHHSQLCDDNGSTVYPYWQLYGEFKPEKTHSSPNCPDVLLQAGGQEPRPEGPQFDQGGSLGQGGLDDPGHGNNNGEG